MASQQHEYTCICYAESLYGRILNYWTFVLALAIRRSFLSTQQELTGRVSGMIKFGSFTAWYLTAIKVWQQGKGPVIAWHKKNVLYSICAYSMPAGRLPITEWMAVACFVICQWSVARETGVNKSLALLVKGALNQVSCHRLIKAVVDMPKRYFIFFSPLKIRLSHRRSFASRFLGFVLKCFSVLVK